MDAHTPKLAPQTPLSAAGWRAEAAADVQPSLQEVNATASRSRLRRPLGAPAAGRPRAGLSGLRRLHGSRQLGDRPRGRVEVWLHAAVGHPDLEPDGDPAAGAGSKARHRHRPRSGAGLPRCFSKWVSVPSAVGRLRSRDHRLRPRRGDRHRDRAESAVRHSPGRRRADHGTRRLPAAAVDEPRLSLSRSFCDRAPGRDRGLLRGPDRGGGAAGGRDAARIRADRRDLHQSRDALPRDRHHRRDGDAA